MDDEAARHDRAGDAVPATETRRRRRRAAATGVDPVEAELTPSSVLVVGPFHRQREAAADPLQPAGGEPAIAAGDTAPSPGESVPSALAVGGSVAWRRVEADDGTIAVDFTDAVAPDAGSRDASEGATDDGATVQQAPASSEDRDESGADDGGDTPAALPLTGAGSLQSWYGRGGVGTGTWYALATVEVDGPRRAVVRTDARVCWVNGRRHEDGERGDQSSDSTAPPGVFLREGVNHVLLKTWTGLTEPTDEVGVRFRPPRAPTEVNFPDRFRDEPQNVLVPHLVAGEAADDPVSVRVTNTTLAERAPTLTVEADHPSVETVAITVDPPLAPFETRRVETRLRTDGPMPADRDGGDADDDWAVPLTATVSADGAVPPDGATESADGAADGPPASDAADAVTVDVPVARPGEPRRETFVSSLDGAVAEYSVRPPAGVGESGADPSGPFGCVLSLHGATVPSIGQASATDPQPDAYVCAGAARGPLNFNHDGFGRLDDLEALSVCRARYDVDPDRVTLTGHSMGGHGAWQLATTHPDRFAAVAPSAGYMEIQRYVTVPFRRRGLHGDPDLLAVQDRSVDDHRVLQRTTALADGTLPAFVLHGAADEEVPAFQARTLARTLAERGLAVATAAAERHPDPDPDAVDAAYLEVPGADHWWDRDLAGGDGVDAINHPDLWAFLRAAERDPSPDRVRLVTANLGVEDRKHWVRVLAQERVHRRTVVDARVADGRVVLDTDNVAVAALDAERLPDGVGPSPVAVVDGERVSLPDGTGTIYLDCRDEVDALPVDPRPDDGLRKDADRYGPMGAAITRPYRLVYGTAGDDAATALSRELACLAGRRLVDVARSHGTVVPDRRVDPAGHDRNLLLFGRPGTNAALDAVTRDHPVTVGDGYVDLGPWRFTGDLGVEYVYPDPGHPERLFRVTTGTSRAGLALTRLELRRPGYGPAAGAPDVQVYDRAVRSQGTGGLAAAGFFDREWAIDPDLLARRAGAGRRR
ncbi:MAG: prolyl oligopeptidase family serine peptidase [Halobacteriaceae archaeon]